MLLVIIIILVWLSIQDLIRQQIASYLLIPCFWVAPFFLANGWLALIIGIYVLLLSLNTKEPKIGNGDLDIIFLVLLYTSLTNWLIWLTLASGLVLVKMAVCKNQRSQPIPFVPYLTVALIFGYFIF
ncbi:MAG: hypothetical protein LBT80_02790 [Lactobacillaceae bacterium]|nr:hypothetical protein [Lactobacillaceae bacterium]